jgi:hypothetical protein
MELLRSEPKKQLSLASRHPHLPIWCSPTWCQGRQEWEGSMQHQTSYTFCKAELGSWEFSPKGRGFENSPLLWWVQVANGNAKMKGLWATDSNKVKYSGFVPAWRRLARACTFLSLGVFIRRVEITPLAMEGCCKCQQEGRVRKESTAFSASWWSQGEQLCSTMHSRPWPRNSGSKWPWMGTSKTRAIGASIAPIGDVEIRTPKKQGWGQGDGD